MLPLSPGKNLSQAILHIFHVNTILTDNTNCVAGKPIEQVDIKMDSYWRVMDNYPSDYPGL
jgi:hypothetical protein